MRLGVDPLTDADISEKVMGELDRRLMPDSCEWPVFEDGFPVRIGDAVRFGDEEMRVEGVELRADGFELHGRCDVVSSPCAAGYAPDERVKRPAPKVLDADGAEIRRGDTVYLLPGDWCGRFPCFGYHEWDEMEVLSLSPDSPSPDHEAGRIQCKASENCFCYPLPSQLTHAKPEIDTWERIEEDAGCTATKYNERRGTIFTTKQQVARDLVRRARALAERGQ